MLSRKEMEMGMDKREFAKKMLEWSDLREKMDDLEATITAEVMRLGKTVDIGYTSAVYSAGRTTYGWEQVAMEQGATEAVIEKYTTAKLTTATKWSEVCKEMEITDPPVIKAGTPSVTLKLVK